mmetsp:Transcript_17578/g.44785  ORF Transcript_17578/g.44785 Transcript_17578/m.44785 type:complete len:241 (-) Transcript_17578:1521-2243(-)
MQLVHWDVCSATEDCSRPERRSGNLQLFLVEKRSGNLRSQEGRQSASWLRRRRREAGSKTTEWPRMKRTRSQWRTSQGCSTRRTSVCPYSCFRAWSANSGKRAVVCPLAAEQRSEQQVQSVLVEVEGAKAVRPKAHASDRRLSKATFVGSSVPSHSSLSAELDHRSPWSEYSCGSWHFGYDRDHRSKPEHDPVAGHRRMHDARVELRSPDSGRAFHTDKCLLHVPSRVWSASNPRRANVV